MACNGNSCEASKSEALGTTSGEALECNAGAFDKIVNQQERVMIPTRTGTLPTLYENLSRIGYEPPIAYASGVSFAAGEIVKTVSRPDDAVPTTAVIYAPYPNFIPFTLTGTWGTAGSGDDSDKLYVVQTGETQIENTIKEITPSITNLVFNTVADMKTGMINGEVYPIPLGRTVKTIGKLTKTDAQGAEYILLTSGEFSGTPDEVTDFASTSQAGAVFFDVRIKDTQPTAYAKDFKRFAWGNEYLYALTRAFWQSAETAPKCVFSGDSTTAGVFQVGEPNTPVAFKPDIVMDRFARYYGTPITAINSGWSGETTVDWDDTRVAQDIANHPDMTAYFARWGINDAAAHGSLATYEAALDSGLNKLRAFKSVQNLAIILMMPNNIYDPAHGRTGAWMEQLVEINYRMAQKHFCYFFDTYAFIRDVVNGGGWWIDAPVIGGEAFGTIHPSNEHNMWTYSKLAEDVLLPSISAATNVFQSFPAAYRTGVFSRAPNAFEAGVTLERAASADGWPADGMVKTTRHVNNNIIQELYGFQGSQFVRQFRFGIGTSGSWQGTFTGSRLSLTLSAGWSDIASFVPLSYSIDDAGWVTLEGACSFGSLPAADSTIATLPVGFRPSEIITASCASSDSSSTLNVFGAINVYPTGRVSFAAGGDTGNIQMAGIRFRAV